MSSPLSMHARDTRIARASAQVLANYRITRLPADGAWFAFRVDGGTEPYDVRVHAEWTDDPTCSCPDASGYGASVSRGYCKHIIGVLRAEHDLTYQLLELFL
jgi:predicted nucleic acid-binding Zn finger protein